jgi:DegV family protein with EDD domain
MDIKCNLIIDSCCDLPYELIDREGVYLLKYPYTDSSGEHLDDLYQSISDHDFYEGMRNGEEPQTAQIPMVAFNEAFDWAHNEGLPCVFLSFSSGLTGTFDTAQIILEQKKQEHPGLELYAVDTKLASIAEALLVYEALRQRERGLSAKELADWASEAHYFIDEEFMLDDLEALRRGGRIPSSVAHAGAKLDVKPLLTIDDEGKLALSGVARGRKKGIKALVEYYEKNKAPDMPNNNIVIGHSDCPKDAQRLVELLRKIDESAIVIESRIGPVIGSHVGPGMLAIVFWGEDSRLNMSVADRLAHKVKGKQ